jgi:hypothetical protein
LAERGGLVAPVGRAMLLFDVMRGDGDPAGLRVPGGAGVEAAGGIVDPGVEILIGDAGQIGIAVEKFVGDAGAIAEHLAIFDGPALEVLGGLQVGVHSDQGQGGDMGEPVGAIELIGREREQELGGELREKERRSLAGIGLLRGAEGQERDTGGVENAGVAEGAGLERGEEILRRGRGAGGEFAALVGGEKIAGPGEDVGSLHGVAGMGERPVDGFPALLVAVSDGVVEGELEAALGRIGDGLDAGFEVEPAEGLAVAITLEAAQEAGSEKRRVA